MIIGITGKAGSGKDTVADLLVHEHGFVKVAMADPLKRICMDLFGFSYQQLWGPSKLRDAPDPRFPRFAEWHVCGQDDWCLGCGKPSRGRQEPDWNTWRKGPCLLPPLSPREALQSLGTEWARGCYPNVWIEYAMNVVKQLLEPQTNGKYSSYGPIAGIVSSNSPRPTGVVLSDVRFLNEVALIRIAGGVVWKTTHGSGLSGAVGQHESERVDQLEVDTILPSVELNALPMIVTTALSKVKK